MPPPEIIVKKDADELSSYAAELFTAMVGRGIDARGSASVSLAGGSTPRKLYLRLSTEPFRSSIDWSKVVFFFGDERNVPPDSADSNFRMANETLLRPLGVPHRQIFRWRTEIGDPNAAAREYEQKLHDHINTFGSGLDVVLLGLGADGHTASLFPHSSALSECERAAVANWVEAFDDYRLTITFSIINGASSVIFLISGAEKAPAVAKTLEGDFRPNDLPAQSVQPENGSLYWLLDEPAASLLSGR